MEAMSCYQPIAEVVTTYRPECERCQWFGKRTTDWDFAAKQAVDHDLNSHNQECMTDDADPLPFETVGRHPFDPDGCAGCLRMEGFVGGPQWPDRALDPPVVEHGGPSVPF